MTTRSVILGMIAAILTLAVALPAYAGPPQPGPRDPADLDRVVFVHYPRGAQPPAAAEAKGGNTPRNSSCPDPAECADYRWTGHKWFASTVPYELNTANSGLSGTLAAAAVGDSFRAWTSIKDLGLSVTGSTGTTSCSTAGATANSINQVCWRDISGSFPNAIAVTFVWYYRSNKQIVEADAVFNTGSGFTWSYTDPGLCGGYGDCNSAATDSPGTYDVRNIGTHEFGHFLAFLGDLYNARDGELTMYGYGSQGELKKDSLGKGDCKALAAAYGGTCP